MESLSPPQSSLIMAVDQEQKAVPPSQGPLSTHIILSQRRSVRTARQNGVYFKSSPQKAPCPVHRQVTPRPITGQNGQNVDERLKAARERREQQQWILVSREQLWRERKLKAKQFYEKQLQERQRRLLQQRRREETRRSAVEEKRRLQLLEEKERYESAVRKTLERGQRAENHSLSRGRKPSRSNVVNGRRLSDWQRRLVTRLLTPTCSSLNRSRSLGCQGPGEQVSCHSTTTSTTSTPRPLSRPESRPESRPQSRLQSRPQSRPESRPESRAQSRPEYRRESRPQSRHESRPESRPQSRPEARPESRPQSRPPRTWTSSGPRSLLTASPSVAQVKAAKVDVVHNKNRNHSFNATFLVKSSPKPSPSAECSLRKSIRRHSAPQPPELPSVPEEEVAMEAPCPGNTRPLRTLRAKRTSGEGQTVKICEERPPEAPRSNLSAILETQESVCRTEGDGSPTLAPPTQAPPTQAPPTQAPPSPVRQLPDIRSKSTAGTTDPEQAARVLSEKRRLHREREEQERLQREEDQRKHGEELERRRTEERGRQEAAVQLLIEEKRRREEEEQRRADEERAQAQQEAQLLQKQREEEQAKDKARVELLQQQRKLTAQKEEGERQARKKRLEEIMRRTRRADPPDMMPVTVKENTQPLSSSIEEAAKVVTKPSTLEINCDDDVVPVVAFKERRSLRTLTGLDEIQSQQRAEVL